MLSEGGIFCNVDSGHHRLRVTLCEAKPEPRCKPGERSAFGVARSPFVALSSARRTAPRSEVRRARSESRSVSPSLGVQPSIMGGMSLSSRLSTVAASLLGQLGAVLSGNLVSVSLSAGTIYAVKVAVDAYMSVIVDL